MVYLLGFAGLAALVWGADLLVRGGSRLAASFGVPPLIIGLTLVAFGTSAPELVVSVQASLRGIGDIAIGNVVGSNIANIALILGLAALVRPIRSHLSLLRRDVPLAILAGLALSIFVLDGKVTRLEGTLLLTGLVAYLAWTVHSARTAKAPLAEAGTDAAVIEFSASLESRGLGSSRGRALALTIVGLTLLTIGSRVFVDAATSLARVLGWSEAIIGLTIVALGTSLPELATSFVAALRGEGDIAAGNVVGSNLFNALGIAGTSALVHPLTALSISRLDLAVMLGLTLLLWPMLRTHHRIDRWEGAILVAAYIAYVTTLLVG